MIKKLFVLYDGRALSGDTDEATVMDTAESEAEASAAGKTRWIDFDVIWYEYDVEEGTSMLINERRRLDLPPRRGE